MVSFDVHRFDEVTSTNDLVKQAIEQGLPEGFVCRAAVQTFGYGRQGRAWSSPRGGLYQSLLLRPDVPRDQLPTLGLVVALAVRRALLDIAGFDAGVIRVKWPNDVVCAQGKLSGISCEAHAGGVCVGVGVNVHRPDGEVVAEGKYVPAYLSELADGDRLTTATVDLVGDAVLDAFAWYYDAWLRAGFASLVQEYSACSLLDGQAVRIEMMDGSVLAAGTVTGVDGAGRLLVETATGIQAVSSGEAHIV